jgi:hypothetical protein
MTMPGVAHVHSRVSFDGHHALGAIVAFFRRRGARFVLMSEHTRGLTDTGMAALVAACARLSDDRCLVVPGIECEATPREVHVLAYNVRRVIRSRDAGAIAREAVAAGGLAVLAHPGHAGAFLHVDDDAFGALTGVEIWNGKADGRWSPDWRVAARLRALRARHPHLVAFAGADLHRLESYAGLGLTVDVDAPTVAGLLAGLRDGRFRLTGAALSLDARDPRRSGRALVLHGAALAMRRVRRGAQLANRWLAAHGAPAPDVVRRAARRILT